MSQAPIAAGATLLAPGSRLVCHLGGPPRGFQAAAALRRADIVIAPSADIAAEARGLGVAPGAIAEIPPAADAAAPAGLARHAVAARLGLDPGRVWTLCVAPLVPASRLERLLWAIDQLGVVHRRLEHVLVGAGPLRARLLHRARAQRLAERLRIVPHLDCLPDLLREVRLVWQSGEVACGGAILDGMAVGLPAVAVTSAAARISLTTPAMISIERRRLSWSYVSDTIISSSACVRSRSAMIPLRTVSALPTMLKFSMCEACAFSCGVQ
jgi:hypothetical protein